MPPPSQQNEEMRPCARGTILQLKINYVKGLVIVYPSMNGIHVCFKQFFYCLIC